MIAKKQQ